MSLIQIRGERETKLIVQPKLCYSCRIMRHDHYDADFFRRNIEGASRSAAVIVPHVLEVIPAKSVADVGCGVGVWAAEFLRHKVQDVLGIDGVHVPHEQLKISPDRFVARDLSQGLNLNRRFDLAVCLEVAEHLPATRAESLVADLVSLAPAVLFSAAIPNQRGVNHVNEQWPEYWQKLFAVHNYRLLDCIRSAVWLDGRVEWWYRQNILLYLNEKHYSKFAHLNSCGPLSVVHPEMLKAVTNTRNQIAALLRKTLPAPTYELLKRCFLHS